ncbi:MAG: cell division protein FtsK [Streptosporangiaceae bacterium]
MSDHPTELEAVPADPGTKVIQGQALFADVTTPGTRKPVLPDWAASREAAKHHAKRVGGHAAHATAYHGLRAPWYLLLTAFWAVVGTVRLVLAWLRWWLIPIPPEVWADSITDGHRAWHRAHSVHKETTKVRGIISIAGVGVVIVIIEQTIIHGLGWTLFIPAAATLFCAVAFGRPPGTKIVQSAKVPALYEPLTQDVITRSLAALGMAGINQWLRENKPIEFVGPVRQDGPGWRAEVNLPYGVTATEVIDRREKLASGLRRPLGAVWPEPVTTEHSGRLELWVGQEDITTRKLVPWPLLKSGTVDVFKPVPFGTDTRGKPVVAPLIYHNYLIGSMPRNGKTGTMRELAAAVSLDPLCGMWMAELKGTGDLDPFEPLCLRFVSGIDDASIEYAAESLAKLRGECERRAPKIKALPMTICPERRVTREIAQKYKDLRPLAAFIDECQNLFSHPKWGKKAGADAEFIIKVGPAMGIMLFLATQRPDKLSTPTGVSANASIRFCLYVAGQIENDMILGTSSYQNGIRATLFRPEIDAGLGYLKGATAAPKVVRTYFMDVPQTQSVVARARLARERGGTLPVQGTAEVPRDVLADTLAVFGDNPGLHWDVLAERLAAAFPDRYAGITSKAVTAELRAAGVASVSVSMASKVARGARKSDIEAIEG